MIRSIVAVLGWIGVPVTMLAGTFISNPKTRLYGFYSFILAEFLLCGVQFETHNWNQVVLLVYLCGMNAVGIINEGRARA